MAQPYCVAHARQASAGSWRRADSGRWPSQVDCQPMGRCRPVTAHCQDSPTDSVHEGPYDRWRRAWVVCLHWAALLVWSGLGQAARGGGGGGGGGLVWFGLV